MVGKVSGMICGVACRVYGVWVGLLFACAGSGLAKCVVVRCICCTGGHRAVCELWDGLPAGIVIGCM